MIVVAKQIERANAVVILPEKALKIPELQAIAALYPSDKLANMEFVDDAVMHIRILGIPILKLKYFFEPRRIRLEDEGFRKPAESSVALELHRTVKELYPQDLPVAYGFNYDCIFRFDSVIPQRDIMNRFVGEGMLDNVSSFGWQITLSKDKGKRVEVYFFKVVSAMEISVHANIHFDAPLPKNPEEFKAKFEACYDGMNDVISKLAF